MNPVRGRWHELFVPLAFLLIAASLTGFITDRPEQAAQMARGIAGPTTWPRFMLYGVMVFSLGWAISRGLALRSRQFAGTPGVAPNADSPSAASPSAASPGAASTARILVGIVLVLAYGFSLPILGFAFGTVLYLTLWMLLGGQRSRLAIALIAIIGTTAMLYLFVKLALMPLDRGAGVIGEWTVALYRLMGIY